MISSNRNSALLFIVVMFVCYIGQSYGAVTDVLCPRNMEPLVQNNQPKACQPGNVTTCPDGYFCNRYVELRGNVERFACCGKAVGYCDNGEVYIDPITHKGQECIVGGLAQCPRTYRCTSRVPESRNGFCCLNLDSIEPPPIGCPWGTRTLKDSSNKDLSCTPGKPQACPGNAVCYFDSVESTNKCCGKDPGQGCPRGNRPQKNNGQLITCRPGVPSQSCQGDGVCSWSYLIDRYQCCLPDNGCPDTMEPLIGSNSQVTTCQIGAGNQPTQSCPSNYQCSYNFWTGSYQCCGQSLGECPSGTVPYRDPASNLKRACPATSNTCPSGFNCQTSSKGQRVCCGTEGQCPAGLIPTRDSSGRSSSCSTQVPTSCTSPSTCQQSQGGSPGLFICCQSSGGGTSTFRCSNSRPAELNNFGQAKQCTLGITGICNNGYQCDLSSTAGVTICCQSSGGGGGGGSNTVQCPNGLYPYTQQGQVQYCSSGNCIAGYNCMQASGVTNGQLVCCGSIPNEPRCQTGRSPEIYVNSLRYCNPSNPSLCTQPTYTCQPAVPSMYYPGQYICCTAVSSQNNIQCPNGQTPEMIGNSPKYCPGTGCSFGYSCQNALNLAGTRICCRGSTTNNNLKCPTGYEPNMVGSQPQQCTFNVPNACVIPYQCTQAYNQPGFYVCCRYVGVKTQETCPNNMQPLYTSGAINYCSGFGSTCSSVGYQCQQSPTTGRFVCCSGGTTPSTPQCANGRQVYTQPGSNTPYYCLVGGNQCPATPRYECASSTVSGRFVCCLAIQSAQSKSCASGRSPYLQGSTPRLCSLAAPSCPEGYSCELSEIAGQYICCFTGTNAFRCPNNYRPFQIGSDPQTCQSANPTCPAGYSCIASTRSGTYVCCQPDVRGFAEAQNTGLKCFNGNRPFVTTQGDVRYCSVRGFNVCPSGYGCQEGVGENLSSKTFICCEGTGVGNSAVEPICPTRMVPDRNTVNGASRTCADGCRDSFSCVQSTNTREYICCKPDTPTGSNSTPVSTLMTTQDPFQSVRCLSGAEPSRRLGSVVICDKLSGGSACSNLPNSQCQASSLLSISVCCESNAGPQCINGLTAYERDGKAITCNVFRDECPKGYMCQQASANSSPFTYFCCESPKCPNFMQPYFEARTGFPRYCQANSPAKCPGQSNCIETANIKDSFICCQPAAQPDLSCKNSATFKDNGRAQFCELPNTCPEGYDCTNETSTGQRICCVAPKEQTNSVCPRGEPYIDDLTNGYMYCKQTGFACPKGYICKQMVNYADNYICCKANAMCQRGWLPYVDPSTSKPKRCSLGSQECNVPGAPYKCQLSTVSGESLCCMESLIQWERENKDNVTKPSGSRELSFEEFLNSLNDER